MLRHIFSWKFIRALWLAARRGAVNHPVDLICDGFNVGWTLIKTLFSLKRRAPRWVVKERLTACHQCPIYCHELGTCGDAREVDDNPLGCHCYMPVKARIADAECWLHGAEQLGPEFEGGWPIAKGNQ